MEEEKNNNQEIQPTNEQVQNNENSPKRTIKDFVFWVGVAVVGAVIATLILAFVGISQLGTKIQQQNTVIQGSKTQIENLTNHIQQQNSIIQSNKTQIENLKNYITVIQQQINVDNRHNRGVIASGGGSISAGRDVIGSQTNHYRR